MNGPSGQYTGHWSTHQLTEYFAALSLPEDEGAVLRVAIERVAECLDAEFAAVALDHHLVASLGFGATDAPPELGELPLGAGRSGGTALPDAHYLTARMDGPGSLSSTVSGRVIVGRFEGAFAAEEEQMLKAMSTVLGLVLRNLRSLAVERARQNLLRNLLEVQRSISTRRPLQEVLDAVTGATSRLLGVATASLVLTTDDDVESLRVVSHHGNTERVDDPLQDDAVAVAAARVALESGFLVTATAGHEVTMLADVVAVPVRLNAEITGALVAWKAGWGDVSELHAELMTMFANQVSVAITDAHTMATLQEALHDSLTGLANRELFHDRLEHACSVAGRREEPLSLLFIDLDNFKSVNDTLGHAAGDQVLVEAARRITHELRASDTAARLGGDEFVVLLEGLTSAQAMDHASRIVEALRRPVLVDGQEVLIGASIGIADGDHGHRSANAIVAAADKAMYDAKRSRSGQIFVSTAQGSEPGPRWPQSSPRSDPELSRPGPS